MADKQSNHLDVSPAEVDAILLTVRTAELVAKVSNKFKYALGGPAMTRRAHLTRKNRKLKHQILHYHEQRNPTTT